MFIGQGEVIRTSDILLPNSDHYFQATTINNFFRLFTPAIMSLPATRAATRNKQGLYG
jgi:hypothetical protein